jgi:serine/threonine protein kinase
MVRVMQPDTCPTELDLEWFVGLPATVGDEATRIETHLSQCDRCRDRVSRLRTDELLLRECRDVIDVARAAEPMPAIGGNALGHFTLIEELGSGGQGVVWKALDRRTNRHVAMKVLRLGQFAPARQRQRLDREIEIVASLRHAGIVTLYETLDLPSGGKAIVMELIDGEPLDRWAARSRESATDGALEATHRERVLTVLADVCEAIHHAHLRGVIHRDLKPSNVLIDRDGHPHIVDFGIATAAAAGGQTAITTEPIGSPPYMAPEQVLQPSETPDARSDVYSLGSIAFEAITGRRAFPERRSVAEFARTADAAQPPRASSLLTRTPRPADLDAVLAMALATEPERRYDSSLALARDLRALRDGAPVHARRESLAFHLRSILRQHRRGVAVAAAAFAVLLTGAAVYLGMAAREEARQRELVGWGTSLSALLADAELDFPDGSIGKRAAIRLDDDRVHEAVKRLDGLLARGELTSAEETELCLALARICYIAGASLDRAEQAAARSLHLLQADEHAKPEAIWQCGELLAALRLRRTNGRDGIAQLAELATQLDHDPRSSEPLKATMRQRLSTAPILQQIEQVSGTLEEVERRLREANQ